MKNKGVYFHKANIGRFNLTTLCTMSVAVFFADRLRLNDKPKHYFVLSGGCFGSTQKRTIVGGYAWAWWLVTDVQRISLEVSTKQILDYKRQTREARLAFSILWESEK